MFSQPSRRFGIGGIQDPWFRIGTLEVGSAGVVSLIVLVGMLIFAFEGPTDPVTNQLEFVGSGITRGEVWRLFTWFIPNVPSIWTIFSAAIIFFLGTQLEGALGRVGMAKFLLALVLIPSVVALFLYAFGFGSFAMFGGQLVSSGIFYTFVAYMPGAKFFFGIPGWVIAAVFFALEALAHIADRNTAGLLFLFLRVGGVLLAAKAFGLANEVAWIPDLRVLGGGGAGKAPQQKARGGRSRRRRPGKDDAATRPMVVVDSSFEEMGIDDILDQISAFGMDSLNAAQRKKLDAYSKGRRKDK